MNLILLYKEDKLYRYWNKPANNNNKKKTNSAKSKYQSIHERWNRFST